MRTLLLILLVFLGLGALFGGGMLILSPSGELMGMPLSMLDHSPFHSFLLPGIILFSVLGLAPVGIAIALVRRPASWLAERLNLYKDMYWGWTFCIYIAFALISWIQVQMIFLQAVHWLHTFYMFFSLAILLVALWPQVRDSYKKIKEDSGYMPQ